MDNEKKFLTKFGPSLEEASEKGQLERVKYLCTHDGMINAMHELKESEALQLRDFFQTKSFRSVEKDERDRIIGAEEKRVDIQIHYISPLHNALDKPLRHAIQGYFQTQNIGCLEVVKYLLSVGANPNGSHVVSPMLYHDWENENIHATLTKPFSELTQLLVKAELKPRSGLINEIIRHALQDKEPLIALTPLIRIGVNIDDIIKLGKRCELKEGALKQFASSSPLTLSLTKYHGMITDYLTTQFRLFNFDDKSYQLFCHWFFNNRGCIFNFLETYQSIIIETFPFPKKPEVKKNNHVGTEKLMTWNDVTSKERSIMECVKIVHASTIEANSISAAIKKLPVLPPEIIDNVIYLANRERLSEAFYDYLKRTQYSCYIKFYETKNDHIETVLDRFFLDKSMKIRDHKNTWFSALKDPFTKRF